MADPIENMEDTSRKNRKKWDTTQNKPTIFSQWLHPQIQEDPTFGAFTNSKTNQNFPSPGEIRKTSNVHLLFD